MRQKKKNLMFYMQLIAKTFLNGSLLLPFQINESEKAPLSIASLEVGKPPSWAPTKNRTEDLQLNAAMSSKKVIARL